MSYNLVLSMDDIRFHCNFFFKEDIWDRQSSVSINICLKSKRSYSYSRRKQFRLLPCNAVSSIWMNLCLNFLVLFSNTEIAAWFTPSSYFIAQTKQSTCLRFLSIWNYTNSRRYGSCSVSLESRTGKGKRS